MADTSSPHQEPLLKSQLSLAHTRVATVEPVIVPSDFQHIQGMSSAEVEGYLNSPHGTRKISGMEKLLFPFTIPGAWRFYLRGVATTFIIVLISCVSVTLWIARAEGLA